MSLSVVRIVADVRCGTTAVTYLHRASARKKHFQEQEQA